jgi:hypothetical protein
MADKTTFDKIFEWYCSSKEKKEEIVLHPDEQEALRRWDFLDDMLRKHRPSFRTRDIKNSYLEKFPGMSERQFYYDLRNAQRFFGSMGKVDKEYWISVQVEWYKQLRSVAELAGDYKAAVMASKQIDNLLGLAVPDVEGGAVSPTTLQIVLQLATGGNKILNIDHLQKANKGEFLQIIEATNQLTPSADEMEQMLKDEDAKYTNDE